MIEAGVRPEKVFRYVYDTRRMAALKLNALVVERAQLELEGRLVWAALSDEDLESLGAYPEETENLIDELRSIEGVQVALLLKKRDDIVKGSLRAKGEVDVSAVAMALGGGGHKAAAGFPFEGTAEEAAVEVERLLVVQLGDSS